jgi:hypothetical protein
MQLTVYLFICLPCKACSAATCMFSQGVANPTWLDHNGFPRTRAHTKPRSCKSVFWTTQFILCNFWILFKYFDRESHIQWRWNTFINWRADFQVENYTFVFTNLVRRWLWNVIFKQKDLLKLRKHWSIVGLHLQSWTLSSRIHKCFIY